MPQSSRSCNQWPTLSDYGWYTSGGNGWYIPDGCGWHTPGGDRWYTPGGHAWPIITRSVTPHTRGDEPMFSETEPVPTYVFPTPVGMNRLLIP